MLAVTPAGEGEPADFVPTVGLISLGLFSASYLLGLVVFLIWLYRARINLMSAPEVRPRWSPGWTIGAWFIPYGNLVLGPMVLGDVARNSQRPEDVRARRSMTAYAWTWLSCYLVGNLIGAVLAGTADSSRLTVPAAVALTVVALLLAVAAACISVVVTRTTRAQAARFGLT